MPHQPHTTPALGPGALPLTGDEIVQLRIVIRGIVPPIWHRIQLPTAFTFDELHEVIQRVFDWENIISTSLTWKAAA